MAVQMFSEVARRIAGDQGPPPSPYTPWRFGNPLQLLQDLKCAHFSNAHCTAYSHPMTFPFADLVAFQLGPNGQSRPLLDKLKATGKENIYEEAPQVCPCIMYDRGLHATFELAFKVLHPIPLGCLHCTLLSEGQSLCSHKPQAFGKHVWVQLFWRSKTRPHT